MDDGTRPDLNGWADSGQLGALSRLDLALSSAENPIDGLKACLPDIETKLAENCTLRLVEPAPLAATVPCARRFPVEVRECPAGSDTMAIASLEILPAPDPRPGRTGEDDRLFLEAVTRLTGLHCRMASLKDELKRRETEAEDVQLAIDLQRSFQPGSDFETLPIWGVNRPVRQVSGDFFDFYWSDKGHYAFALGDVSGKGMGAALLMAKTISLFRCLSKRIDSPGRLLAAINAELCETSTRGLFVSMVAGHYDPARGTVTFANAGHEPPLVRHKNRTYGTYPADAPPLGILDALAPRDERVDLDGGEFYVFSDGLTEYRYASGEQLGVDGLIQLVEVFPGDPPAQRLESLIQLLDDEAGWEAKDDLTVLIIDDSWVGSVEVQPDREAVP